MLICGMDLSTPEGGVALLDTRRRAEASAAVRSGYTRDGRRRDSSTLLLPALERLLRAMKRRVRDLDVVCVTTGPGSFTGLRVALATATGLAFDSARLRMVGVGTLHAAALAHVARGGRGWLSPVFPAGRGEIYAALFRAGQGRLRNKIRARLLRPEAWAAELAPFGEVAVFGPGAALMAPHAAPGWRITTRRENLAVAAARFAAEKAARGEALPPPRLVYVRPPDALLPKHGRGARPTLVVGIGNPVSSNTP